MAITGFPDNVKVTLGSFWQAAGGGAGNGLEDYGVGPEKLTGGGFYHATPNTFILTKVAGQNYWTEDGTTVADASTNRLMWQPDHLGFQTPLITVFACTASTGTTWDDIMHVGVKTTGPLNPFTGGTGTWYSFKRLWKVWYSAITVGTPQTSMGNYYVTWAFYPNIPSPVASAGTYSGTVGSTIFGAYGTMFSTIEEYSTSWQGTVGGVSNPAYILTVDSATIASVNGVSSA
jgi:hypothetical protein